MKSMVNIGAAAVMSIAVPMAALSAVTEREAKMVAEATTISVSMLLYTAFTKFIATSE